jgi:DNA-binding NtrC family response regulator
MCKFERGLAMTVDTVIQAVPVAAPPGDEQFVERRRISMLEPDTALRSVMTRCLLALGCVVSAKRELAQLREVLCSGPCDGAIISLAVDVAQLSALQAANARDVPIVVLTDGAVEPQIVDQFPAIHFMRKPFDTRQLLVALELPHKAILAALE